MKLSARILLLLVGATFAGSIEAGNNEHASRYQALIAELRCLVCQNQTIAESNAPLAADLREQVRAQIEAGRSDAEIIEFVTARYGDFVLYRPPFKRSTWLLWLGPFVALVIAAGAAFAFVRRSRRNFSQQSTSAIADRPRSSTLCEAEIPLPAAGDSARLGARIPSLFLASSVLIMLVFAVTWYALAGSWRTQVLLDLAKTNPAAAEQAAFEDILARLQEHVSDKPSDADGWLWLGRSYMKRERYPEAAAALARANELSANRDPDTLVEEGEALVYAQGTSQTGTPAMKFEQALELAPDHPRALWFAGLIALHGGNERAALIHWERLASQDLPSDVAASLQQSVAELRQRTGIKPSRRETRAQNPLLEIKLTVSVASELRNDLQPGATLFVFAQSLEGAGPPLAARRFDDARFPVQTALNDSHSVMTQRKLSSSDRWRLVARLSRSGDASPQPGDLEGELQISREAAGQSHNLIINRKRT